MQQDTKLNFMLWKWVSFKTFQLLQVFSPLFLIFAKEMVGCNFVLSLNRVNIQSSFSNTSNCLHLPIGLSLVQLS